MGLDEAITQLRDELAAFECRPYTLLPDLVLFGLLADLLDSATAVAHVALSNVPHKAYPNARAAFEAAQNALVLVTHEDYARAGARAWVYYQWKDREWRCESAQREGFAGTPLQWLQNDVSQMANIWNSMAPCQGNLLLEELAAILPVKALRPDNWLAENMTRRQHRAYQLLAAAQGNELEGDSAEVNQAMYHALCRETHGRPRFDSIAFTHDRRRSRVRLEPSQRNMESARGAVLAGTALSLQEALGSLGFWKRRVG
jgi:hypothetical protein